MEAALKEHFETDFDIELRGGARGIFDVKLEQEMLFSKHKQTRFPESNEIVELLKEKGFQ